MWIKVLLFTCLSQLIEASSSHTCPSVYWYPPISQCLTFKSHVQPHRLQSITGTVFNAYNRLSLLKTDAKQPPPHSQCLIFLLSCIPEKDYTAWCRHENGSLFLRFKTNKYATAPSLQLEICASRDPYEFCPVKTTVDSLVSVISAGLPSNETLDLGTFMCSCSSMVEFLRYQLKVCSSLDGTLQKVSLKKRIIEVILLFPVALGATWVGYILGMMVLNLARHVAMNCKKT